MRTGLARAGFLLLCALRSPDILVGYVAWVARILTGGRSGLSVTGTGSAGRPVLRAQPRDAAGRGGGVPGWAWP